jgi:hypothetical protein
MELQPKSSPCLSQLLPSSSLSAISLKFLIPSNWFEFFLKESSHLFLGLPSALLPSKVAFIIIFVLADLDMFDPLLSIYI